MEKKQILIVEDESIVAMDLELQLINLGYQIAGIVSDGQEALDVIDKQPVDLVLMDITIKGDLDGIETTRLLLQKRHIPVVFLTASGDRKTVARATDTQAVEYLVKPLNEDRLMEILSRIFMGN
jgi:CheY-like chemotaxis protein